MQQDLYTVGEFLLVDTWLTMKCSGPFWMVQLDRCSEKPDCDNQVNWEDSHAFGDFLSLLLFFLLLRSESLSSGILHWITSVLLPKLQHIFSAWQFKPAKTKHSILFISLLSHELTDNYFLQRFDVFCILYLEFNSQIHIRYPYWLTMHV